MPKSHLYQCALEKYSMSMTNGVIIAKRDSIQLL